MLSKYCCVCSTSPEPPATYWFSIMDGNCVAATRSSAAPAFYFCISKLSKLCVIVDWIAFCSCYFWLANYVGMEDVASLCSLISGAPSFMVFDGWTCCLVVPSFVLSPCATCLFSFLCRFDEVAATYLSAVVEGGCCTDSSSSNAGP